MKIHGLLKECREFALERVQNLLDLHRPYALAKVCLDVPECKAMNVVF
jgi:hypothetical protein